MMSILVVVGQYKNYERNRIHMYVVYYISIMDKNDEDKFNTNQCNQFKFGGIEDN